MKNIKQQVKDLWRICFDDSDGFIDLYFRLRYRNDINVYKTQDGHIVSALQMIPYPITFYKSEINSSYISGACTHPDYRRKGMMQKLLVKSFKKMYRQNVEVSTLIPANKELFDYYRSLGYNSVFKYKDKKIVPCDRVKDNIIIKNVNTYRQDVYDYLNTRMHTRNCCVQHTEKDFKVILSDINIGDASMLCAWQKEKIVGIVIYYTIENITYISEMFVENRMVGKQLVSVIYGQYKTEEIKQFVQSSAQNSKSLGMIRIIKVLPLLKIYAHNHLGDNMNVRVVDPIIEENTGYYKLHNGECSYSKQDDGQEYLIFNISELPDYIFKELVPYMSLMLD